MAFLIHAVCGTPCAIAGPDNLPGHKGKALVTNSSGRDLSNRVQQHPSIAALRCYTRPGHSKGTARSDNSDIIFLQAFLNNVVAKAWKQKHGWQADMVRET